MDLFHLPTEISIEFHALSGSMTTSPVGWKWHPCKTFRWSQTIDASANSLWCIECPCLASSPRSRPDSWLRTSLWVHCSYFNQLDALRDRIPNDRNRSEKRIRFDHDQTSGIPEICLFSIFFSLFPGFASNSIYECMMVAGINQFYFRLRRDRSTASRNDERERKRWKPKIKGTSWHNFQRKKPLGYINFRFFFLEDR